MLETNSDPFLRFLKGMGSLNVFPDPLKVKEEKSSFVRKTAGNEQAQVDREDQYKNFFREANDYLENLRYQQRLREAAKQREHARLTAEAQVLLKLKEIEQSYTPLTKLQPAHRYTQDTWHSPSQPSPTTVTIPQRDPSLDIEYNLSRTARALNAMDEARERARYAHRSLLLRRLTAQTPLTPTQKHFVLHGTLVHRPDQQPRVSAPGTHISEGPGGRGGHLDPEELDARLRAAFRLADTQYRVVEAPIQQPQPAPWPHSPAPPLVDAKMTSMPPPAPGWGCVYGGHIHV